MALHAITALSAPTNLSDNTYRVRRYKHTLPSMLAVLAGIALLAASASTNAIYGWGKSDFLPQQITWAVVSIAASVILALCPTAILKAIRARSLAGGAVAVIALALTGSYSFTAAIGASAGQRMASQASQTSDDGTRARLQRSYDAAIGELATLAPSRPVSELEALIAKLKATPGARCDLKAGDDGFGPVSRKVCGEAAGLAVELARANRRAELQAVVDQASGELNDLGPPHVANTDASALSAYLAVAGGSLSVDALNRWLALLAVALVEFGPGLSFALASVLKVSTSDGVTGQPNSHQTQQLDSPVCCLSEVSKLTVLDTPETADEIRTGQGVQPVSNSAPAKLDVPDAFSGRLVALLKVRGGEVYSGHRSLAKALGCSPAHVGNVLRDLASAGTVTVAATKTGTVVRLANAA